jgi:hypothetical protein
MLQSESEDQIIARFLDVLLVSPFNEKRLNFSVILSESVDQSIDHLRLRIHQSTTQQINLNVLKSSELIIL